MYSNIFFIFVLVFIIFCRELDINTLISHFNFSFYNSKVYGLNICITPNFIKILKYSFKLTTPSPLAADVQSTSPMSIFLLMKLFTLLILVTVNYFYSILLFIFWDHARY